MGTLLDVGTWKACFSSSVYTMLLSFSVVCLGVALPYHLRQRGNPGTPASAARQTTLHYETFKIVPGAHDDELHNQFLPELTKLNPHRSSHILDIGFGSGRCIDAFVAAGHRVLGLDSCQAYVQVCRERADAFKLPHWLWCTDTRQMDVDILPM